MRLQPIVGGAAGLKGGNIISKKNEDRYQILSIPFKLINDSDFDLHMSEEEKAPYLIDHDDSLFDD